MSMTYPTVVKSMSELLHSSCCIVQGWKYLWISRSLLPVLLLQILLVSPTLSYPINTLLELLISMHSLNTSFQQSYHSFLVLFLFSTYNPFSGDLCLYNPTLNPIESDGLICAAMLLMMTANRITHATLALLQARNLLKVLRQLRNVMSQSAGNTSYHQTIARYQCILLVCFTFHQCIH